MSELPTPGDKLNLKFDNWVVSRLSEPFDTEDLKYRSMGGETFVYVDARTIVNRLNAVIGADNWEDTYVKISLSETVSYPVDDEGRVIKISKSKRDRPDAIKYERVPSTYDGVLCYLRLLGVAKSDVGSPSNADQLKGAVSDALKRAAVKFGVGSYLYGLKGLRAEFDMYGKLLEPPELPEEAIPVERSDPKDVFLPLIDKARASAYYKEHPRYVEEIINNLFVMGRYDPTAPVVVQRAVYEFLTAILDKDN